jgi:signal transduction histidine kinase
MASSEVNSDAANFVHGFGSLRKCDAEVFGCGPTQVLVLSKMSSVQKKTAVAPANAGSAQIDALSSEILELQRIRENLQTELRQRDEFFSTAAHELRNPLNALHLTLAGITRAQSGSTPIAAEQVLSRINKAAVQVKRLADLIDENR